MPVALAALLALTATPADAKRAAELARRSIAEYNAGEFEAALKDAQDAYLADAKAGLLFNLGQIHRALHHWERAEFNYKRFLAEQPDAPNRKTVEGLIAEMKQKQEEETKAKAAPPPVAPVIVEAPAAPAPAPAPAPAVEAAPEKKKHGHGLGLGLGITGGAFLAFMAVSIGVVVTYNGNYGSGAQPGTPFSRQRYANAQFFEGAEWVSGILGVAGVTAGVLTW